MKKKYAAALMLAAATGLTACSAGGASNDYIRIAKYKGVEVEAVEGLPDITDESVENNIQTVLEGFAQITEVTDRPAREGDIAVLDYTASADGQEIENGGNEAYELELGSNTFFAEFEDAVIGHSVGDSFELEHAFAEDYTNQNYAGKNVTFTITLTGIREKELPDLTDEFVQTISQKSETVDEYREEMRELLEENNEEYVQSELEDKVWQKILDGTEVTEYPKDRLDEEKEAFYTYYQAGADYYGMEFADFLAAMEVTEEEFEEQVTEAAKSNLKENLTAELIAEKEDISMTDEEYGKAKEELADEMSYEDVEEMEEEVEEHNIKSYILRDQVKAWAAQNCIQVKE
ncbi:trigger factor [Mordavella massiliensis]|uniref:Trigger factor n=1 Tax=Mordavella massiliensis TaxID=1871024 RepID=A0A938XBZ9_9CLOT|nr:trigger factor [Mordavella massiliensis]MBM6949245.1 trigger factor [Mordavella massiliensis]